MKIKQIYINGFGKWAHQEFDFSTNFQAIIGQNESGKTTIREFIVSMLFGFPTKKGQANVYDPKNGSKYGGSIIVDFPESQVKITRTGRVQSSLNIIDILTGEEISSPEEWLNKQLEPLNREMFDAIFNFSQMDLSKISKLKVNDLKRIILSIGAINSQQWLKLSEILEKESANQYTQRKNSQRVLNVLTNQYETHQLLINKSQVDVQNYLDLENQTKQVDSKIKQNQETLVSYKQKSEQLRAMIYHYGLVNQANKIKEKIKDSIVSISEMDILQYRQSKVSQNLIENKLNTLKKGMKEKLTNDFLIDVAQFKKSLVNLKLIHNRLDMLSSSLKKLQQKKQAINNLFEIEVPQALSKEEGALISKNMIFFHIASVVSLALIIASYSIFKPGILVGLMTGGYSTYKLMFHYKKIIDIKNRYGGISIKNIQRLQPKIRELPEINQQIKQISNGISKQLHQVEYDLNRDVGTIDRYFSIKKIEDLTLAISKLESQIKQSELEHQNQNQLVVIKQQQILSELKTYELQFEHEHQIQQILLDKYHFNNDADFEKGYFDSVEQQKNINRYHDLIKQIPDDQYNKLITIDNMSILEQKLSENNKQSELIENNIANLKTEVTKYKIKQEQLMSNDQYLSQQQDLANEETELIDYFEQYLAKKLTIRWINESLSLSSENRFPKMKTAALHYFSRLTFGKYVDMHFQKNNIRVVTNNYQIFDINELSTGTKEQLFVALKFALAQVISDVIALPLFIDDGFVNFDAKRRTEIIMILKEISKRQQVFYFSTALTNKEGINVLDL
ncbi:ATP-binding protein [Leuconostoc palmae]|uniref:ATP-binding protein n=1 Tax=Leuconostoc palmae TaxID=501487 RepID=UPI001C7DDC3E|nr:AAA family ATPase [Leuconostoc palmae]